MSIEKECFRMIQKQDIAALKQQIQMNPKIMAEANDEGIPAIHIAMETGNLEMAKFIIEYSIVNPCLLDKEGNTILHSAVKSGNPELVKYLVERVGMDISQANLLGVTAYDLAIRLENMRDIRLYFEEILGCTMDELYHNPIRTGMHPDPSILRVGEDYYMVNSSFVFFPCIPISHSKDLIHWEVIGHAITNPEWARLKDLEGGRGYWAPDISYYEGRFYITATYRMNDGGEKLRYQMVTSSEKPEGPYCEPVFLDEDGIDPSIFTDVDGRRYMLLNRGARIFEISPDGREILSEPQLLWYGDNKKASEGPHLLYKDGYYYLFMAEGGTGMGHRISVARSKTLMGVYESCPYNPILRQWDEERQLQCCGHGKPVQTADGDWYIVYLCYRLGTSGYGFLGRETAMDPITWTADGWPIVNQLKGPSDLQKKPSLRNLSKRHVQEEYSEVGEKSTSVSFAKGCWRDWSTVRGSDSDDFEIDKDRVVIHGDGRDLNTTGYGNILVKPQPGFSFEVRCRVCIRQEKAVQNATAEKKVSVEIVGDQDAGLTCYYDENSYLKLALTGRKGEFGVLAAEYVDDRYVTEEFVPLAIDWKKEIEFRIVTEGLRRSCYYRVSDEADDAENENSGQDWCRIVTFENTAYLSSEGLAKGKRFTGAMVGIYVHGEMSGVFSDFALE